ncbi:MAG TPA: carboxylesterase family protein [Myxococcales bacterium]|nr:carboxylesterase family protein [Myxococcales bacterium]
MSPRLIPPALFAFLIGCAPHLQPQPQPRRVPGARPEAVTTEGVVRGQTDDQGVDSYLGVPFASPPVGPARWREAAPPAAHPPLEAARYHLPCSQIPIPEGSDAFGAGKRIPSSEDCLYLNLWIPPHEPGTRLPVMVWSHGGQYLRGAASQYDGDQLARMGHVIVVTLDYRLGPMGFLAHPALTAESPLHTSGNQTLLDHVQALRWLRANLAAFGGDPDRVTLFGESAGSATACALLGSPLAAGLFQRVVLQSDACPGQEDTPTLENREAFGRRLAKALGCEDADPARELACMRSQTDDQVMTAIPLAKVMGDDGNGVGYRFNLDHVVLQNPPDAAILSGKIARMPVMLGTTDNEMDRYVGGYGVTSAAQLRALISKEWPRDAPVLTAMYQVKDGEDPFTQLAALFSDEAMTCPVRRDARALSAAGLPTYFYRFRHVPNVMGGKAGAFHGSELVYLFPSVFRKLDLKYTDEDRRLAELMSGYWGRFAATGDPNGGGALAWPRYDSASTRHLVLDFEPSVSAGLRRDQCDLWDRVEPAGG